MKKTILVEKTIMFTRIAVLFDNELVGTYIDSHYNPDLQNKVIVGQIEKFVKNLNAYFIDYGQEKKGLLHVSQIPSCYKTRLHEGSRIPVQITKLNQGDKGNKLTANINIKGKYLVCLPFETGINISRKIKDKTLRDEFKAMLKEVSSQDYGFIVRTQAEEVERLRVKQDAYLLIEKARQLMETKDNLSKGSVLYEEPPMVLEVILEQLNSLDEIDIVCDDRALYESIRSILEGYGYTQESIKLDYFNQPEELFFCYDLVKEWDQLMSKKIWLKNGGNIIIEYTEALTVVDVNSAKAILSKNPRKAVLELNELAVREAILQMLRRNLSGMMIIDLVEMSFGEDRESIYQYAKKLLVRFQDKRTTVFPLTELGLLQLSRTKKYLAVQDRLLTSCKLCQHAYGSISLENSAFLIEKKIRQTTYHTTNKVIYIKCIEPLYDFLRDKEITHRFAETYKIEIVLLKTKEFIENAFLCQYYLF